jgi:hypothetical protein
MNRWSYLLYGLIVGLFVGLIAGYLILKKHRFEPGRVVDFYPLRLKAPWQFIASLSVVLISQILLSASLPMPAVGLAGVYAGMHVFYIAYAVLMQRGALLSKSYYSACCMAMGAVFISSTTARIIVLVIVVVLGGFTAKYYEKYYSVRYKNWSQKSLRSLYRKYNAEFIKYDLDEQSMMLCFMMVENTARPPIVRFFERLYARYGTKKTFSTGIMQVKSKSILSDHESAQRGFAILHNLMLSAEHLSGPDKLRYLAYGYNGDHNYALFLSYFYEYCSAEVSRQVVSVKM